MGVERAGTRRQDSADRVVGYGMLWPLLADLEEADQRELLAVARRRRWVAGQVLAYAGDPADALHLVIRGRLGVHANLPTGATAMIHVLGPHDFFGEATVQSPVAARAATVTALEPAETLVVAGASYRPLAERLPGVQTFVSRLMAARIETLATRLFESLQLGLDDRLRARLRDLVRVYAVTANAAADSQAPGPVTIPLNQSQLAELTGGTRPTINQALQRLAEEGVVELARGRVVVLDPARL